MKEQDYTVKDDMICPVTKAHCDDECCPVGSTCNMSSEVIVDSETSFFSEEFKEKMEARRKELNLKWDGWEENERAHNNGGMLIVIAIGASILAIGGVLVYVLSVL
jgi:hypothetical protein